MHRVQNREKEKIARHDMESKEKKRKKCLHNDLSRDRFYSEIITK